MFKKEQSNAILLAIMRGTEGFDDKLVDFGFNFYLCESSNPLLDQQKEGRTTRTYNDKKVGYYGFLVSIDMDYKTILAKRLGNWLSYINEIKECAIKYNKSKTQTISEQTQTISEQTQTISEQIQTNADLINYLDQILDIDSIRIIELSDIKERIMVYRDGLNIDSSIGEISRHMHKINSYKIKNGQDLIDTETKYKAYAEQMSILVDIDIKTYSYNWIRFLRPDYETYIMNFYTIDELKKLKIKNYAEYETKSMTDNKMPSIELINNGIYNDSTHFNLNSIYQIINKKKY